MGMTFRRNGAHFHFYSHLSCSHSHFDDYLLVVMADTVVYVCRTAERIWLKFRTGTCGWYIPRASQKVI